MDQTSIPKIPVKFSRINCLRNCRDNFLYSIRMSKNSYHTAGIAMAWYPNGNMPCFADMLWHTNASVTILTVRTQCSRNNHNTHRITNERCTHGCQIFFFSNLHLNVIIILFSQHFYPWFFSIFSFVRHFLKVLRTKIAALHIDFGDPFYTGFFLDEKCNFRPRKYAS